MNSSLSISAVVITRSRVPLLRRTLQSLRQSTYPVAEIIVSDDSSNHETARMLASEFPEAIHIAGPRRGISANRDNGIHVATSDYVLLTDDDMLIDPNFLERSVEVILQHGYEIITTRVRNGDFLVLPNALDFLGYSSRPYEPGIAYSTANQQCFLVQRELACRVPYDEVIETYGYEEMDFGYRVVAAGATIYILEACVHVHLAPTFNQPIRPEQDASRLYVTYKRAAYVDRRPFKALTFLVVALPHHMLSCLKHYGVKGIGKALANYGLALRMLKRYRRDTM